MMSLKETCANCNHRRVLHEKYKNWAFKKSICLSVRCNCRRFKTKKEVKLNGIQRSR